MSENKRRKMDLGAACSSVDGGEPHIAQQTAITNENEEKPIFDPNLAEFREAVKWSGFVDRSLFIKKLLTHWRTVMIFAPKRFGKSMNLSMVKRFLEIEEGRDVINAPQDLKELENFENFKAFNRYEMKQPCKILAEEDLVKKHFGRHPVLHLSFKDVKVTSIQQVEYDVKEIVHYAYRAHSYLKDGKVFSESEYANEVCTIWCDPERYIGQQNAKGGLANLIKFLHAYHKRKVYLLVDEFDAPTVNALLASRSRDEVRKICNHITNLLGALVKGEIHNHLLGSVITGVSYLGSVGISEPMNNVPIYKWLLDDDNRFAPYYGLSQNELTTLLEHVFPNQDEKQISIENEVKEFYNGYINFKKESVYCLWSVLHYIEKRSTLDASEIGGKSFWGDSSIISKMGSLLKKSNFLNYVIGIMDVTGDGYLPFSPREKLDPEELAEALSKNESFFSQDTIMSFFMEQGCLTRDLRESPKAYAPNIRFKIPNADVLVAFQQMLKDFCLTICGLSDEEMSKCANVFRHLPRDRNDEIFKEKLRDFYNHLRPLLRKFNGQKGVNKRSLQAALYTTMLKMEFEECCIEKYVTIGSRSGIVDQWLRHDTFACILEEKFVESDNDELCKESARQALEEVLSSNETKKLKTKKVPYVEILKKYPNIKNSVVIGICMSGQGEPYMCCLVNNVNPEECITFPEDN